jgi:hypothetical protein
MTISCSKSGINCSNRPPLGPTAGDRERIIDAMTNPPPRLTAVVTYHGEWSTLRG